MEATLPQMFMFAALVLFVCTVLKKFTARIGIPSLLAFLVLGMLFGSDGIFKIPFSDYHMAELISTAALAIIPMADWLEEPSASRMNTPGVAQGNWQWRADAKKLTPALAKEMRTMAVRYFRHTDK